MQQLRDEHYQTLLEEHVLQKQCMELNNVDD